MADLTTLAKVNTYLFGSNAPTEADALLSQLITSSSAWVEARLGQAVLTRTVTETRDGNGTSRMLLAQHPVASVTSVTVDGTAIAARASVTATGYVLHDGAIELVGYTFTTGTANVVVVYSAGSATCPTDLEQAVIEHVALRYRDRGHVGMASGSVGGESATFSNAGTLAYIEGVIDSSNLKRWGVA